MSDGLINREEFIRLLGFTSWAPVKRYIEVGVKKKLLSGNAIERRLTDKNVESFWYPKTWIATIRADWAKPKSESKLDKPRAKAVGTTKQVSSTKVTIPLKKGQKTASNGHSKARTINVTIDNQETYNLLLKHFRNTESIVKFCREKLEKEIESDLMVAKDVEKLHDLLNAGKISEPWQKELLKALTTNKPLNLSSLETSVSSTLGTALASETVMSPEEKARKLREQTS